MGFAEFARLCVVFPQILVFILKQDGICVRCCPPSVKVRLRGDPLFPTLVMGVIWEVGELRLTCGYAEWGCNNIEFKMKAWRVFSGRRKEGNIEAG